jgi:hypothetical protein
MSDSLRNDETLTTADIARRPTPREVHRGPVAVPDNPDRAERIAPDTQAVAAPRNDAQAVSAPRIETQAVAAPRNDARANSAPADSSLAQSGPLFPEDELHNFRARWNQAQTSFVDEPRKAVEQADSLVANVVTRLAEQFSNERAKLEEQWSKGDDVNTEDLRQALRRYRSFFDRLLSL